MRTLSRANGFAATNVGYIWANIDSRGPSKRLHAQVSTNLYRQHRRPHDSRAEIQRLSNSHWRLRYASELEEKKMAKEKPQPDK